LQTAGAFCFSRDLLLSKSPHVVMTPHHIGLYPVVEAQNTKWSRGRMSEPSAATGEHEAIRLYEIRIEGHLDARWADRFGSMTITLAENGETLLTGPVIDQAALHGLLKKVRDLGLPLVSVNLVQPAVAGNVKQ
jgi:hypothetical protein